MRTSLKVLPSPSEVSTPMQKHAGVTQSPRLDRETRIQSCMMLRKASRVQMGQKSCDDVRPFNSHVLSLFRRSAGGTAL